MTTRTSRRFLGLALAATLLALSSSAQARNRDDGDVIHCHTLANCLSLIPAPGQDGDLSGADASDLGSVGDDDGPDLPPIDEDPTASPAPSPTPTVPIVVTTKSPIAVPAPKQAGPCSNLPDLSAVPSNMNRDSATGACTPKPPPPCVNQPDLKSVPDTMDRNAATGVCSPKCANHTDWAGPKPGWRKASDGNCYEIPKLDLTLSGPASVKAPDGAAKFTVTIVNNGSNLASGVLFKQQLDANLALVDITNSQGDHYGKEDDRTYYVSMGTIMPGKSATVTISLRAQAAGQVTTGVVEPGGEVDTNTNDNRLSTTVVPTVLQTELTVQMHGLLWGGHHYGSVSNFAKVLRRQGSTWRGWKKNHPALSRGLAEHGATYRRRRR